MKQRISNLTAGLGAIGAQAGLFHSAENIRYFSGFTGEGLVLLHTAGAVLITDSRYTEQALNQSPGFEVLERSFDKFLPTLREQLTRFGAHTVAFEDTVVSVADWNELRDALPGTDLVSFAGLPERLRLTKDVDEVECLLEAGRITDDIIAYAWKITKPGMTELELVAELDYYMASHHKAKSAFAYIVAAGPNGSMPHAIPSDRAIATGDLVTIDFGAEHKGYKADMTRTFAVGQPSAQMAEVYAIVLEAQLRASAALKPGVSCRAIDSIARDYIRERGYGDRFGHGTGHGVGLMIHEAPRLNQLSDAILTEGMVVTVEPGIYLPGVGGVRIEDTYIITADGARNIFKANKNLVIL